MRDNKNILFIFLGLFIGIILATEVIHTAEEKVCPTTSCLDGVDVIPVSDRGYAAAALKEIESARHTIHIASFGLKYYENYPDSSVNKIVDALIDAHNRGVEVRIIVDQYSKENNAFELLQASGVDIRYDSKSVTTHSKLFIIDGKTVILGSTNLSYYGFEKNSEANVIIRDEKTAEYYENYFLNLLASS